MVSKTMSWLYLMRLAWFLLLLGPLLVPTAGCMGVREAEAGIAPDAVPEDFGIPDGTIVECFHHRLPDGVWENRLPFGEVWTPRVPNDWRPYTYGTWVETDQGWGWVTEEPWGWATYHYGRWFYAADHRWFWVPGTRWAPAWVAWRSGNGYIGWAPLPPSIGFDARSGLDAGAAAISATHFYFIPERALLSAQLHNAILPAAQNAAILQKTSDISHYKMVRHRIFDLGISPRYIAGIAGQRPQRQSVASLASSAGAAGGPGPFYQPPALAQLASRSSREFGSSSNPRQVAGSRTGAESGPGLGQQPGPRTPGDRQAARSANGIGSPARAGRHASIAAPSGSGGRSSLQSGHRGSFGAPTTRNQAGRSASRQAEGLQATRPAAGASGFPPQQSASFRAASPQPPRNSTPSPRQTTPSWNPEPQAQALRNSPSPTPQRPAWAASQPPRAPRASPPPSPQAGRGAPARAPSGGGHRPPG